MKIYKVLLSILGIAATFGTLQAAEKLPAAFLKDDKPISPKCFYKFVIEDAQKQQINLITDKCTKDPSQLDLKMLKEGYYGYDVADEEPMMRSPYIYYKYIGKVSTAKDKYLVLLDWSGGGTGTFTNLVVVNIKDNIMRLNKYIDGGDRCFGGLQNVSYQNGELSYQIKATPAMLIDPHYKLGRKISTIQDCAICCMGVYNSIKNKIVSFSFNGYIPTVEKDDTMQTCLNKLVINYGAKDKKTLSSTQLESLRHAFKSTCI